MREKNFSFWLLVLALLSTLGWSAILLTHGPRLAALQDELNFFYESLRLPAEHRLGGYVHGPFLYEIIALLELLFFVILKIGHVVTTPVQFISHLISHEAAYLIFFRALLAGVLLLLTLQIYRLGKIFGGPLVGGIAALLCANNLTVRILGSIIKEDPLYWLLIFSSLILAWEATEKEKKKPALLFAITAGIALGAATATKYLGAFSFPLFLVPLLRQGRKDWPASMHLAITMAVSTALTTLGLIPFLFTDSQNFFASVNSLDKSYAGGADHDLIFTYLFTHLPDLIGMPLVILGMAEGIWQAFRNPRGPILMGLSTLFPLLFLSSRHGFSIAYYVVPFALFLIILAANLFVRLLSSLLQPQSRLFWMGGFTSLILLQPAFLLGTLKYTLFFTGPDVRQVSKDYLHSHAAPESPILVTTAIVNLNFFGPPLNSTLPPLGKGKFAEGALLAQLKNPNPKYHLVSVTGIPEMNPEVTDKFQWIVIPEYYRIPGDPLPNEIKGDAHSLPQGFQLAKALQAFPEPKSNLYPLPTALDYQALRKTSLPELWRKGSFGHSIRILKRNGTG